MGLAKRCCRWVWFGIRKQVILLYGLSQVRSLRVDLDKAESRIRESRINDSAKTTLRT